MKLSKQIKNTLLSIDTIIDNAVRVSVQIDDPTVTISMNDAKKILEWSKEQYENLSDIEKLNK